MTEIPGNGIDDDCDPGTPAWGTPASTIGTGAKELSDAVNLFFTLLLVLWARWLMKKRRGTPSTS